VIRRRTRQSAEVHAARTPLAGSVRSGSSGPDAGLSARSGSES